MAASTIYLMGVLGMFLHQTRDKGILRFLNALYWPMWLGMYLAEHFDNERGSA